MSDKEIAAQLRISIHTVRAHIRTARERVRATNRVHLVRLARLVIQPDGPIRVKVDDPSLTYFIRRGARGPIKIGKALDPWERMADMQTSHDSVLVLIGLTSEPEKALHDLFADVRLRGEWFRNCKRLNDWIRDYAAVPQRSLL